MSLLKLLWFLEYFYSENHRNNLKNRKKPIKALEIQKSALYSTRLCWESKENIFLATLPWKLPEKHPRNYKFFQYLWSPIVRKFPTTRNNKPISCNHRFIFILREVFCHPKVRNGPECPIVRILVTKNNFRRLRPLWYLLWGPLVIFCQFFFYNSAFEND